jgi:hypothetical protein
MHKIRWITAALTTAAALGVSAVQATPALAASSFSESAPDGSASWGTVTFTNKTVNGVTTRYWNVDAYIYRESNAAVKLEVCGHQATEDGSWSRISCKSATNGGSLGSTRHITTLGGGVTWTTPGMVTTYLYINGAYADGDWNFR